MSDRDIAIGRGAAIEQMLTQIGATGSGLGQKSICLQHLFTDEINRKFKFICFVRNKAAHEVIFEFDRMDRFVRDCDEVQSALRELTNRSKDSAIIQNRYQSQSVPSHNPEFSIAPDLVKFEDLTFSSVTGRLIQTTRNQHIWLRLANRQEEYIGLANCDVNTMRKGHLITVVFAHNRNQTLCLAIYIDELEKYFYCISNIELIRFSWYYMIELFFVYIVWLPICGMSLFEIIDGMTKFILGDFISIAIAFLCSFIIIPFWLFFSWVQNRNNQTKNHVDRIFGHSYVKYDILSPLEGLLNIITKSQR